MFSGGKEWVHLEKWVNNLALLYIISTFSCVCEIKEFDGEIETVTFVFIT